MITLRDMIRQLNDEKDALDATIATIEQLVRQRNEASSKPNGTAGASSKTAAPQRRNRKGVS